jgi:hypothetical protein
LTLVSYFPGDSNKRVLVLLDTQTGARRRAIPVEADNANLLPAFTPDSRTLLATDRHPDARGETDARRIGLWEAASGEPLGSLPGAVLGSWDELKLTPNGKTLLVGCEAAREVQVYDLVALRLRFRVPGIGTTAQVSSDGQLLAVRTPGRGAAQDDHVRVYAVADGHLVYDLDVAPLTSWSHFSFLPGRNLLIIHHHSSTYSRWLDALGRRIGFWGLGNGHYVDRLTFLDPVTATWHGTTSFRGRVVLPINEEDRRDVWPIEFFTPDGRTMIVYTKHGGRYVLEGHDLFPPRPWASILAGALAASAGAWLLERSICRRLRRKVSATS